MLRKLEGEKIPDDLWPKVRNKRSCCISVQKGHILQPQSSLKPFLLNFQGAKANRGQMDPKYNSLFLLDCINALCQLWAAIGTALRTAPRPPHRRYLWADSLAAA